MKNGKRFEEASLIFSSRATQRSCRLPLPRDKWDRRESRAGTRAGLTPARLFLFEVDHRDAARRAQELALRGEKLRALEERAAGVEAIREGVAQEVNSGGGAAMGEDLERVHDLLASYGFDLEFSGH